MAEELLVNITEDEELEKISRLGVIGVIWSELNGGNRSLLSRCL